LNEELMCQIRPIFDNKMIWTDDSLYIASKICCSMGMCPPNGQFPQGKG
jgi:hypothetical protein